MLIIFAYIIMSWVRLPYSPWLNRIQRFLYDVCEPYLRIFRRLLPSFGAFDFSPIVAVFSALLPRSIASSTRSSTSCTRKEVNQMALTPVEIRHVEARTRLPGYRRTATDRLLEEIVDSFEEVWRERADLQDKNERLESDIARYRDLETLAAGRRS